MFQTNVCCFLWDLVDEGIDAVLDRLKGEAGATGITVLAGGPPTVKLRPHPGAAPLTFRTSGGVQFQPESSLYEGTRVHPVVAAWIRKANPLAVVAEACSKRGLTLRASLVCCHNPITVARHDFAGAKDVFGETQPEWLCPSNPDVREYLRCLVQDVTAHYPLEALELQALCHAVPLPGDAREKDFELGQVGQWLLTACFCESCRQAAARDGIDTAAAIRSVAVVLDRIFTTGELPEHTDGALPEFLAFEPLLEAFVKWRAEQIRSLTQLIREACKCQLVLHGHHRQAEWPGADPETAKYADALLSTCPLDENEIDATTAALGQTIGDVHRTELEFSAKTPDCPDSTALVRMVARASMAGVRSVSIGEYGLLPMNRLGWIKQAVRYAQREAKA